MRTISDFTLTVLLLSACACSGMFENRVDFNPAEPLRVAVLPFVQVGPTGEVIETTGAALVDNVPLLSSALADSPPTLVQKLVQDELARSGLDIVSPALVVDNLLHFGYYSDGVKPDIKKVQAASPAELCRLLFCDALLYGKVTKWERSYYGVQSVARVGADLRLVSAKDGRVLFSSAAEDYTSRGLTKGPTGISSLVIEPLRGLNSQIIAGFAAEVVSKMIEPLYVQSRPGYLESSPPAIYGAAHTAANSKVRRSEHLYVLMLGSPNNRASFSIGTAVENVPMVQRDEGNYVGEYHPLPGDKFADQPIFVDLTDKYGRTTRRRIGKAGLTLS